MFAAGKKAFQRTGTYSSDSGSGGGGQCLLAIESAAVRLVLSLLGLGLMLKLQGFFGIN